MFDHSSVSLGGTCFYTRDISMAELIHLLLPPAPKVTPANVSGGGGSRSELVITWEVSELAHVTPPPGAIVLFILGGCGPQFH